MSRTSLKVPRPVPDLQEGPPTHPRLSEGPANPSRTFWRTSPPCLTSERVTRPIPDLPEDLPLISDLPKEIPTRPRPLGGSHRPVLGL